MVRDDLSRVRGFNYQPGYASNSYEAWRWFNGKTFARELRWGKKAFPGINTIRLWLSWDAYIRVPDDFRKHFEEALEICDSLGLKVIACLFNRWHNTFCDNGGIFMERLLPGTIHHDEKFYRQFLLDICGPHKDDDRILIWDLCNEPFSFDCSFDETRPVVDCLMAWLTDMRACLDEIDVSQYIGVSVHGAPVREILEIVEPISTVLMVHPYLQRKPNIKVYREFCDAVIRHLDWQKQFAEASGKPLLVTECCWGSIDDEIFAENVRATLSEYTKRNIGFVAHALAHSEVADLHSPNFGGIQHDMGQFNFLDRFGNIRKGLEVFNTFCEGAGI